MCTHMHSQGFENNNVRHTHLYFPLQVTVGSNTNKLPNSLKISYLKNIFWYNKKKKRWYFNLLT